MDEERKPGVTPSQIILLMGVLSALGLLVGSAFAFQAEQPMIGWILVGVGLADLVSFIVLWRLDPLGRRGQAVGMDQNQRDAMVAELERRHDAGEIDAEALERAKRSLSEQA